MCVRERPCGGVLYEDSAINADMERGGCPQRAVRCLNGHTFYFFMPRIPVTAELMRPDDWCKAHGSPRPCQTCAIRTRKGLEARQAGNAYLDCAVCGKQLPQTKYMYCSVACREKAKVARQTQKRRMDKVQLARAKAIVVVPRSQTILVGAR